MYETQTETEVEHETPSNSCRLFMTAKDLVDGLRAINALVDECRFVIHEDKLTVRVVDPAHIAMVDVEIPLACPATRDDTGIFVESEFGIDTVKLGSYLKGIKKKDMADNLFLTFDKIGHALSFDLDGISYKMDTIDTNGMSDPKIPNLSLPGQFAISDAKALVRFIKTAEKVSDKIRLTLKGMVLCAETANDTDKVTCLVEGCREDQTGQLGYTSLFPMEYLKNILKSLPENQAVLRLGDDYPINIQSGYARYLLAPRIETSD